VVAKVTEEMDETIVRQGEDAVAKAGLPPMHPEIVKLLGRSTTAAASRKISGSFGRGRAFDGLDGRRAWY
jgi:hypothetical protein